MRLILPFRIPLRRFALLVMVPLMGFAAYGQDYPAKPVRVSSSLPPGAHGTLSGTAVATAAPASSVKELFDYVKKNPAEIETFGESVKKLGRKPE